MTEPIVISQEEKDLLDRSKGMLNDPAVRARFLGTMKEKFPDMPIPEVDVPAQFSKVIEAQEKRLQEMEAANRERETREKVKEARAKALAVPGITSGDIEEVEKIMVEQGIGSHETAAKFLAQSRQIAGGGTNEHEKQKKPAEPNAFAEAREKFGGDVHAWGKAEALRIGMPTFRA